jgi:hypothetical protein
MAKRFTDTEKWKKDFIRALPAEYKLLWLYITDDCTNAGIWEVEIEVAELRLGIKLSKEKARGLFQTKVVELDNGTKWFIPDFINFQYGQLTTNNRAHLPVISTLKKLSLLTDDFKLKKEIKEDLGPLQGAKDKEKEMEMDMDMEKDKMPGEKFIVPQMCEVWYRSFPSYSKDKQKDFEAMGKILAFIQRQSTDFSLEDQDKILNTVQLIADEVGKDNFWINKPLKSISNHIQEFYNKIKNPVNGKHSKNGKAGFTRQGVQDEFDKRFAQG